MKQRLFNSIVISVSFGTAALIFFAIMAQAEKESVLHQIYMGGPLVIALMALSMLTITYIIERLLSLGKAQGKGNIAVFLSAMIKNLNAGEIDAAIKECDKQRGSLANIIKTGLERYLQIRNESELDKKTKIAEVKRVIEESTMLEMPILEKNLISLSTIASISTMVGLLGTVLGMIRSFSALSKSGGAVDAAQLSQGISEALINTAGGIAVAIVAIVAYNFMTTKIDGMTYMIDETSSTLLENLEAHTK